MSLLWGIDLGGTKIEGVVIEDRESLNVLKRMRIPTEASKGYLHIVRQIYKLLETMIAEVGVKPSKIGIGTPGTLDPVSQTMKNSNTTCLNGEPLKRDLERVIGIPIEMANDANCFAMAETHLGAVKEFAPGAGVVFGVIMGTGVGGGLVINGKVRNGRMGIGGEWGHNWLEEGGYDCYCGSNGCVEQVISGPALERFYAEKSGTSLKLKEIIERYHANSDAIATETVDRLIYYFGKGLASVVNIVDPDAIVLGGGLSKIDLLYSKGVKSLEHQVFNKRLETLILKPKLGDSAGVFGAALL